MAGRLEGKVAIITGAGGGIGRATALRFAEEGASVVANDIVEETLEETVSLVTGAGGKAVAAPADITRAAANVELTEIAVEQFGDLDVFYCNAGGATPTPMLEIDEAEYRRRIALNLDGVWFGAQAAIRAMLPRGGGVVLTTTSGAGLGAVDGLPVYGAAKAGVINLMKSVAQEFGPRGIRSATISPGPMATPGMLAWLDTIPNGREKFAKSVPVGRMGTGEDIAEAAVFLASDQASFVNGAVLPVDGGAHALFATPRMK